MDIGNNNELNDITTNNNTCYACKKNSITYTCMPCRCEILCKSCAMKMATGGKCKNCHELFVECRRIIK